MITPEQIAAHITTVVALEDEIAALRAEQAGDVSDFRREQINRQVDRINDTIIRMGDKIPESYSAQILAMRRTMFHR